MKPFFLHKPAKDLKGIASRATFIPSGEAAWPRMRSTAHARGEPRGGGAHPPHPR